ncbi:uncharacterized protein LOC115623862 [Scaptodrosophila lebanonensis]|uniref:Uncharacterized protein LOC115623862 n=1 Tax=Drosophila lebanonensis TaxID=7225 RepID=A0A6J2TGW7_DROLE|nr:uncharacterized protein LOC115623862 [Scaptodrosophila lebanonensis]
MNSSLLIFLLLWSVFGADAFNYTSCDQAKKPKMLSSCCKIPIYSEISKSCRKSIIRQNKTTNWNENKLALNACTAECVFKSSGYLLSNGSADLPAIQKDLKQRFKNDSVLAKVMNEAFNSCVDYAQKRTVEFEWLHVNIDCNYYPATLLACVMEQVYENCPSSKWKNSDECESMRKYLIACDDVHNSN